MANHKRPTLAAEPRERGVKKSELKHLRRSGQVPALIYGHGDPQTIQVPTRALREYLHHHAPGGLLDVALEGRATPALIREVERDPVTGDVIHLGFQRINMQETLRVMVPLVFHGEEELISRGLVFQRQADEIEVHGRADQLPETIVIDVATASAGDSIRVGDLPLPEGIEATKDHDLPVATITEPSIPADVEAALDAEEAAHADIVASHEEAATADADGEGAAEE
jgi:large subunit ribosomal protein L25